MKAIKGKTYYVKDNNGDVYQMDCVARADEERSIMSWRGMMQLCHDDRVIQEVEATGFIAFLKNLFR
jgi:hypothetical protein